MVFFKRPRGLLARMFFYAFIIFQVVARALDWTFAGRAEMVRSILDVLSICSLMPKVQLIFCSQITFHDDMKSVGISVILSAADGDIVMVKTN